MNATSRILSGGVLTIGGLSLIVTAFFTTFFLLIYGIIALVIGVFILFNRREDDIEQIKFVKGGKKK